MGGKQMDDQERALFETLRAKMPERSLHRADLVARLRREYVTCGRDIVVEEKFDRFLEEVMGLDENGHRLEGNFFYITGESGSGKTRMVQHLLEKQKVLEPTRTEIGEYRPCLSISLTGATNLRLLGNAIVKATGYESDREMRQGDVWAFLPGRLRRCRVLLIHIDEMQHALKGSQKDLQLLRDALKALMSMEGWPVSFLLSGLPNTTEISRVDGQVERRNYITLLPAVKLPRERKLIVALMERLSKIAEIDCKEALEGDVLGRIAHAANYQYGRIGTVIALGLRMAALEESKKLNRMHFSKAYRDHSEAAGRRDMNPFEADNWKQLDAGSFIVDRQGQNV